jgi:hypothetical protein
MKNFVLMLVFYVLPRVAVFIALLALCFWAGRISVNYF